MKDPNDPELDVLKDPDFNNWPYTNLSFGDLAWKLVDVLYDYKQDAGWWHRFWGGH
jgi:hypothetical protein